MHIWWWSEALDSTYFSVELCVLNWRNGEDVGNFFETNLFLECLFLKWIPLQVIISFWKTLGNFWTLYINYLAIWQSRCEATWGHDVHGRLANAKALSQPSKVLYFPLLHQIRCIIQIKIWPCRWQNSHCVFIQPLLFQANSRN